MTASIHRLDIRQQSEFVCSACGSARDCNCNAPALNRLADLEAQQEKARIAARERKRRQREKEEQNQQPVTVTDNAFPEGAEAPSGINNPERKPVGPSPQERWTRAARACALDASTQRWGWTDNFGEEWQTFEVTSDLVAAADQAAEEWKQIATFFRSRLNAQT